MTEREYLEKLLAAAHEFLEVMEDDEYGHPAVKRWHDLKDHLAASTMITLIEAHLESGNIDGGEDYDDGL